MTKSLVSVVTPIFNEEESLEVFLGRLLAALRAIRARYDSEIVLVDDGSRDRSLELCRKFAERETGEKIKVVELRRNFGQTAALQAGLDQASGDVIITMDSDLQHFPEEIPVFLAKLEEGYDLVCGWRHQRREGVLRRIPSRAANFLIRKISGIGIRDFGTTFRAYRRDIVKNIRILGEQHRFIPVVAANAGARITEIPIQNIERPKGKSNYGLERTLSVFLDLIYLYFNVKYMDRPLRAFGKLGLLSFAAGMAILVPLTVYGFSKGVHSVMNHIGWFTLGVALVVASLHFVLTGVLAEILVRIYFSGAGAQPTFYRIRKVWGG